jgi:hypothetical protein
MECGLEINFFLISITLPMDGPIDMSITWDDASHFAGDLVTNDSADSNE